MRLLGSPQPPGTITGERPGNLPPAFYGRRQIVSV